ncbi:MAG: sialidase family protein [Acidobacteriota bacterium]
MHTLLLSALLTIQIGPMDTEAAREPQMAATKSMVGLTFGAGKAIYFSASHDAGKTFSVPVKVAGAELLPLSRHRGPRLVMQGNTVVITAVTGRKLAEGPHAHGLPADGDLWAWQSADGGTTWSKGVRINDVAGAPTEGLHALSASDDGVLFAAWLDKRSEKGTGLYGARSTDGGVTWTKNVRIYESPEGTICQCCHPSAAFGPGGEILVMWRNWIGGSRDMYLARSRDGVSFSKPEKLGNGTWPLNACPMDGGGLVVAKGRIVTAWRREGEVYMASPGENEVRLGKGIDVSIAAGTDGVHAIWAGADGVVAYSPATKATRQLAEKGTFPNLVALPGGGVLAAWEADGRIVVQAIQ